MNIKPTPILKPKHHSITDWDFDPNAFFYLDNAIWVSSPSSLAVPSENWPDSLEWLFLKAALAPNLKQGRVITYERFTHANFSHLRTWFRAQALPDPDVCFNSYRAEITDTTWRIQSVVGGVWTTIANGSLTFTRQVDTWYKHRFTFWTYLTAGLITALRTVWDIDIAGNWVPQFDEEILNPLWQGSSVNLIGFNPMSGSITTKHYIDDTEIWEPAS